MPTLLDRSRARTWLRLPLLVGLTVALGGLAQAWAQAPDGPAGAAGASAGRGLVRLAALPSTVGEPVCKGYRIVQPGTRVRNGELLEFFSYWEGADSAAADLHLLDSEALAPLSGTYIGDSSVVEGDVVHLWSAFWFTYSISPGNGRLDASGIPVALTGVDAASGLSATNAALSFCLSNHPPRSLGTKIIGPTERFIEYQGDTLYTLRNGELLTLETTWSFQRTPFFTEADFSALDDSFAVEDVYYQLIAAPADTQQTHRIYYELDELAQGATTERLPIRVTAYDGGCGRDSVTQSVLLDNEGPTGTVRLDAPADSVTEEVLALTGTAPAGAHDVLVLVNRTSEFVFDLVAAGDSLIFSGTVTLQAGDNTVVAFGRDLVGNRSLPSTQYPVAFLNAPQFKRWQLVLPDTTGTEAGSKIPVRNGDLIVARCYWDAHAPYTLSADFGELDTGFQPGAVLVSAIESVTVQVGDTTEVWAGYQIEYRISAANSRSDDDGISVAVAAFDPSTGFSTTTESLTFCLTNEPPVHLGTTFLGPPERFVVRDGDTLFVLRNGITVYMQSAWAARFRPLVFTADFSSVDDNYFPQYVRWDFVDSLSTDSTATYVIYYDLSIDACCGEGEPTYPLPITIQAQDRGCGESWTTLWIEMDNAGPPGLPTLDALPAATTEATLAVSGQVPAGSHWAELAIEHADADSTTTLTELALDAERAFSATVPLLAGENRVTAYGTDAIGNRSEGSVAQSVRRVTTATQITVPNPFHAGDRFELEDQAGYASVVFEVFNLEGDRIRRWAFSTGTQLYAAAAWDGRNGNGEEVRQGPYLLRIETRNPAGRTREEVRAFVFQR